MVDRLHSRRSVLATSAGVVSVGLAGCTAGAEEEGGHTEEAHHEGDGDHDDGGTDHSHGATDELGDPTPHVSVSMETHDDGSKHFMPHVVHVEPGGSVEWTLENGGHQTAAYHPETHGHDQRIPDGADPWKSGSLENGESFSWTFDVEGVYDFVCKPHEADGMVGSAIVGWPDPDEQPALEPPSDRLPDAAVAQLEEYNHRVREVLEDR